MKYNLMLSEVVTNLNIPSSMKEQLLFNQIMGRTAIEIVEQFRAWKNKPPTPLSNHD